MGESIEDDLSEVIRRLKVLISQSKEPANFEFEASDDVLVLNESVNKSYLRLQKNFSIQPSSVILKQFTPATILLSRPGRVSFLCAPKKKSAPKVFIPKPASTKQFVRDQLAIRTSVDEVIEQVIYCHGITDTEDCESPNIHEPISPFERDGTPLTPTPFVLVTENGLDPEDKLKNNIEDVLEVKPKDYIDDLVVPQEGTRRNSVVRKETIFDVSQSESPVETAQTQVNQSDIASCTDVEAVKESEEPPATLSSGEFGINQQESKGVPSDLENIQLQDIEAIVEKNGISPVNSDVGCADSVFSAAKADNSVNTVAVVRPENTEAENTKPSPVNTDVSCETVEVGIAEVCIEKSCVSTPITDTSSKVETKNGITEDFSKLENSKKTVELKNTNGIVTPGNDIVKSGVKAGYSLKAGFLASHGIDSVNLGMSSGSPSSRSPVETNPTKCSCCPSNFKECTYKLINYMVGCKVRLERLSDVTIALHCKKKDDLVSPLHSLEKELSSSSDEEPSGEKRGRFEEINKQEKATKLQRKEDKLKELSKKLKKERHEEKLVDEKKKLQNEAALSQVYGTSMPQFKSFKIPRDLKPKKEEAQNTSNADQVSGSPPKDKEESLSPVATASEFKAFKIPREPKPRKEQAIKTNEELVFGPSLSTTAASGETKRGEETKNRIPSLKNREQDRSKSPAKNVPVNVVVPFRKEESRKERHAERRRERENEDKKKRERDLLRKSEEVTKQIKDVKRKEDRKIEEPVRNRGYSDYQDRRNLNIEKDKDVNRKRELDRPGQNNDLNSRADPRLQRHESDALTKSRVDDADKQRGRPEPIDRRDPRYSFEKDRNSKIDRDRSLPNAGQDKFERDRGKDKKESPPIVLEGDGHYEHFDPDHLEKKLCEHFGIPIEEEHNSEAGADDHHTDGAVLDKPTTANAERPFLLSTPVTSLRVDEHVTALPSTTPTISVGHKAKITTVPGMSPAISVGHKAEVTTAPGMSPAISVRDNKQAMTLPGMTPAKTSRHKEEVTTVPGMAPAISVRHNKKAMTLPGMTPAITLRHKEEVTTLPAIAPAIPVRHNKQAMTLPGRIPAVSARLDEQVETIPGTNPEAPLEYKRAPSPINIATSAPVNEFQRRSEPLLPTPSFETVPETRSTDEPLLPTPTGAEMKAAIEASSENRGTKRRGLLLDPSVVLENKPITSSRWGMVSKPLNRDPAVVLGDDSNIPSKKALLAKPLSLDPSIVLDNRESKSEKHLIPDTSSWFKCSEPEINLMGVPQPVPAPSATVPIFVESQITGPQQKLIRMLNFSKKQNGEGLGDEVNTCEDMGFINEKCANWITELVPNPEMQDVHDPSAMDEMLKAEWSKEDDGEGSVMSSALSISASRIGQKELTTQSESEPSSKASNQAVGGDSGFDIEINPYTSFFLNRGGSSKTGSRGDEKEPQDEVKFRNAQQKLAFLRAKQTVEEKESSSEDEDHKQAAEEFFSMLDNFDEEKKQPEKKPPPPVVEKVEPNSAQNYTVAAQQYSAMLQNYYSQLQIAGYQYPYSNNTMTPSYGYPSVPTNQSVQVNKSGAPPLPSTPAVSILNIAPPPPPPPEENYDWE